MEKHNRKPIQYQNQNIYACTLCKMTGEFSSVSVRLCVQRIKRKINIQEHVDFWKYLGCVGKTLEGFDAVLRGDTHVLQSYIRGDIYLILYMYKRIIQCKYLM